MVHRKVALAVLAAGLAVAALGAGLAGAQGAPSRVTISTPAKQLFKINRFAQETLRWNRDDYTIRAGGTLVFHNLESDDPHTFSVVKESELPRTGPRIQGCGAQPPAKPTYAPCRRLVEAHAPDPEGKPQNAVVNAGQPGIDRAGDSVFIPPKGAGPRPTITVSAKRGTTLYFMCLVHPWMQAELHVR